MFIIAALSFSLTLRAQKINPNNSDTGKNKGNSMQSLVEVEPSFPGGIEKLYEFIGMNVKSPGDRGKVLVTFIIEKDGSLSDIQAVRGPSSNANNAAVKVMKISPKWNPGTQNGKPVRVRYTLPINFN